MSTPSFASQAPAWGAVNPAAPVSDPDSLQQPVQALQAAPEPLDVADPMGSYELLPTAAKVALLTAAKDGLLAILAREKAKLVELNVDAGEPVQSGSLFGTVNYQPPKEQHKVDDEALLEYVRQHPELAQHIQTVEIVPDWVRSTLVESVTHQGDGVYTLDDGTVVDFMTPGTPTAPQVAYPASKQQKATKRAAEEVLQTLLDTLADRVSDATRQTEGAHE